MPASGVFFNGNFIKTLKSNLNLFDQAYILTSATDPTSVATNAPEGSLLLHTASGALYRKLDSGSTTNWAKDSGTNSGDVSLTAFGSTPSANGASLSGQALTLQPADATHPGGVSITTQTLAGDKTFSGNIIPTQDINFTLDANHNITISASSAGNPGNQLIVKAANSGTGTDLAGGLMIISSGSATGNGQGKIQFETVTPNQGSGTTVRAPGVAASIEDANEFRLFDFNTFNYVGQKAPVGVTSYTLSYPTAAPVSNGKVISYTTAGVGSFISPVIASSGDISETSFSLANNQSSAANVTGLSFSTSTIRAFEALVSVSIDATSDLFEVFKLRGIYNGTSWDMAQDSNGDASLVVFTITNAGQVQYTSANYSGFVSGTIKFRAMVTTQ